MLLCIGYILYTFIIKILKISFFTCFQVTEQNDEKKNKIKKIINNIKHNYEYQYETRRGR
jgi:hypothetical protein